MENYPARQDGEPFDRSYELIDWSKVVISSNWANLENIKINPESPAANIIRLTPPDERNGSSADVPWFLPDDELAAAAKIRQERFDVNPERVLAVDEDDPVIRGAAEQLLHMQARDLAKFFPDKYYEDFFTITNSETKQNFNLRPSRQDPHPLAISGLLSQADICLVEEQGDEHILVAGFVATPTDWDVTKFIGKNMDFVHQRFPGYMEPSEGGARRLKDAVDKSLNRLQEHPGLQLGRNNIFLTRDPSLAVVPGEQPVLDSDDPIDSGYQIFIRTERETLTRLPRPFEKYIVFTIEPRVYRLADVAEHRWKDMITALHTNQKLREDMTIAQAAIDYLSVA